MAKWTICHFCERFGVCEPWLNHWRCTDCRQASLAWAEDQRGQVDGPGDRAGTALSDSASAAAALMDPPDGAALRAGK